MLLIVLLLIAICLSTIGLLTSSYVEVGTVKAVEAEGPGPSNDDAAVPQSVIDDAAGLARGIVGDSQDKLQSVVDQLLTAYKEARNTDVVVFFNSGGWGWNQVEKTPGWDSIVNGIRTELEGLGYRSQVLDYQRTSRGVRGCIREFFQAVTPQNYKAEELAERIKFLTDHLPDLKVIVAGESTGSIITDKTMTILQGDTQVYSIQTGTPFWYKPVSLVRTLLMNSNGKTIDSFSYGRISSMIWATVKGWFGFVSLRESPGTILNWLRAPGHDYSWQYPEVCSEVIKFLKDNFKDRIS